jgi:hypothetical protein
MFNGPFAAAALVAAFPVDSPLVLPQAVRAIRVPVPIVIDGVLDPAEWRGAVQVSGFVQRDPDEGGAPTESTVVFVAYDDDAIYIGARLFDQAPDSILARLGRRDAGIHADEFAFYVDAYHDRRSGFFFGLSAAGTMSDGVLYNDDWDDDTWDGVWQGEVATDSLGWSAEMRIPYSQLRFRAAPAQVWGVNFRRMVARKNEVSYYVLRPKKESGFVSRFADLVGIEGVRPRARVEVLPYVTSRAQVGPHTAGDPFYDGSTVSATAGADVRAGVGGSLTLNATVNPDFGQVEVDPAVVNLSDVETFFDEKRPFFIENSSIFNFGTGGANNYWGFNWAGPDFFYTRRIGRAPQGALPYADYADVPDGASILGAAKLTGKVAGSWNVGLLSAVTRREMAHVDSSGLQHEVEVEPLTYYGVARVQKEFPQGRQGLGAMVTYDARDFDDPALRSQLNSTSAFAGVDGWTFLDRDKEWVVTGWMAGSQVRGTPDRMTALQQDSRHYLQRPDAHRLGVDPDATSLSGWAGRVYLNKQKGNWFSNSAFGVMSPGFDVHDLGFMSRTGLFNTHAGAGRQWTDAGRILRRAELGGALFRSWNWDGDVTWTGAFQFGWLQFLNYYSVNWSLAYNPETVNDRRTRGGPLTLNMPGYQVNLGMNSDGRKAWTWGLFTGVYVRSSEDRNGYLNASLSFRPAPNLALSFEPGLFVNKTPTQYIGAYADSTATATFDQRYVFASLDQTELSGGMRLDWTFTPKLSLQLYVQPLVSSADYGYFRGLAQPRTHDYDVYDDLNTYNPETHTIYPNGRLAGDSIVLYDPDFTARSLRGNAVLRWEYRPGSTLYFVWTQSRSADLSSAEFDVGDSMRDLMRTPAENIFMIKATYWWTP